MTLFGGSVTADVIKDELIVESGGPSSSLTDVLTKGGHLDTHLHPERALGEGGGGYQGGTSTSRGTCIAKREAWSRLTCHC